MFEFLAPAAAIEGATLRPDLARPAQDTQFIVDRLRVNLDGYAACVDHPFTTFVPELLRAYPDAMVVITVRDFEPWAASMERIAAASLQPWLRRRR